jgi:AcrR family transcriptional regulator
LTSAKLARSEDVRAAADVSSSQLYHYFEDKPALVRAVVDQQADSIVGGQQTFDLSSLDGLRAWRDWPRCKAACFQRDTKPLEAALDAMLELLARVSGGNQREATLESSSDL